MIIILSLDFFIPEVKNQAMSRLLNACLAIFKYSNQCLTLSKLSDLFTKETHSLEQVSQFFKQQHESLCKQ